MGIPLQNIWKKNNLSNFHSNSAELFMKDNSAFRTSQSGIIIVLHKKSKKQPTNIGREVESSLTWEGQQSSYHKR